MPPDREKGGHYGNPELRYFGGSVPFGMENILCDGKKPALDDASILAILFHTTLEKSTSDDNM